MYTIIIRYKKVEKTYRGMDYGVRVLTFRSPKKAKERFDYLSNTLMGLNNGKIEGECYEDSLLYMWIEKLEYEK